MIDPFAGASQLFTDEPAEPKRFGNVYGGRYHMPLLSGEAGTKEWARTHHLSGTPGWVPNGMVRGTNIAGAISDSEALSVWEQEQALIGLVIDPSLYEEVALIVGRMLAEGISFQEIKNHPDIREALTGTWKSRDQSIVGRAKQAAGANIRRQMGTNRHTAWEYQSLRLGEDPIIGTKEIQAQIITLETLLAENHLERVPGLSERVVRNTVVNCAGRFDDCLRDQRTGEMFVADLKTKQGEFFTWLEMDIQLAIYASATWMLVRDYPGAPPTADGSLYEWGPARFVNQSRGVVLHMPSDGGAPRLRTADLERGWRNAQLARRIVDERAYGKSAERFRLAEWDSA